MDGGKIDLTLAEMQRAKKRVSLLVKETLKTRDFLDRTDIAYQENIVSNKQLEELAYYSDKCQRELKQLEVISENLDNLIQQLMILKPVEK